MKQPKSSAPVPRYQVFAMDDGEIVVQWSENRVQEITTGRYREYNPNHFGRRLSDYELDRLAEIQIIEHYNRQYIWLYALPEGGRFDGLNTKESAMPRYYYLNTTLPVEKLDDVRAALVSSGLGESGAEAHDRDQIIAITGEDGLLFPTLEVAENALQMIVEQVPLLNSSSIAFAHEPTFSAAANNRQSDAVIDLDALIAEQDAKRESKSDDPPQDG